MDKKNDIKNSKTFQELDKLSRTLLNEIQNFAYDKIKSYNFLLLEETIERNTDNFDSWYSYIMRTNSTPQETLILNNLYTDFFVKNNLLKLKGEQDIVFRFASGKDNSIVNTIISNI